MSLRGRLMATFVVIILLVGLIMGAYQSRLLNAYFRGIASNQLVQQARNMESLISRFSSGPPSNTVATSHLIQLASSVTSSRVIVTDTRGVIVIDSQENQLVGQSVSSPVLSDTLRRGTTVTFDFPSAGADAVGAAVPWRTGPYITGALIFIRSVASVARQSTMEAARFMLRAGLLAATVALLLSYILASNITDPIRRMSQVARSISKGDFVQRVDWSSNDELGDLAQAMNSMSHEISILVDNLTQEKDKLRKLVEERQNMMSDISHDLRTPVTSIRGFVEALQDGVIKGEDEQKRTLAIIHDESKRLSRLVDDLFYLARLEAGEIPVEMAELDFADVVRSSMNAVSPQALEKQLDLRLSSDDAVTAGKAMVMGSSDRLTRAVVNLLDNAVKYSPEGGRVEVALNISQNDTREVTLSVTDQGPGIPPEDMAHLFERFYRADKSRARVKSSAGLGLSIAKLIVDQHNGRLWVESDVGKGSTFIMTLPVQSNGYAKSR